MSGKSGQNEVNEAQLVDAQNGVEIFQENVDFGKKNSVSQSQHNQQATPTYNFPDEIMTSAK